MKRPSTVTTHTDPAGDYKREVFDCDNPKNIIIGVHGNGVRRWDGEKFYYQVAEHFTDSVVVLTDQNQQENDGCRLNSLDIMASRNQESLEIIRQQHPGIPVWIMGHSMGCGVASQMNTSNVDGIIFVAPGVGNQLKKYTERYGEEILNGMVVTTSDGLYKNMSKEFIDSVSSITWQTEFQKLIDSFLPIHVFESGADEIVDKERFELRSIPFTSYTIIEGAKHNFTGEYSKQLFAKIMRVF